MGQGDPVASPTRMQMLKDLTTNYKLKGISYKELVDLLGKPTGTLTIDDHTFYYETGVDYKGIDPDKITNLEFKIGADSIVKDYSINEVKHSPF